MMKINRYRSTKQKTQYAIDLIEEHIKGKIKLSPIRRLSDLIEKEKGVDELIAIIINGNTEYQGYLISERSINGVGLELANQSRENDALKILKLNTEKYPDAYNTYDSYGQILLLTGDKENAIKAYEKSLELNPDNENAKKVLSGLK